MKVVPYRLSLSDNRHCYVFDRNKSPVIMNIRHDGVWPNIDGVGQHLIINGLCLRIIT